MAYEQIDAIQMAAPMAYEQVDAACDGQLGAAPVVEEAAGGATSDGLPAPRARWAPWRRLAALGALGLVATGVLLRSRSARTVRGNADGAVQLDVAGSFMNSMGTLADSVRAAADTVDQVQGTYQNITKDFNSTAGAFSNIQGQLAEIMTSPGAFREKMKKKLAAMNETERAQVIANLKKKLNISSLANLLPANDLADDNSCMDDEEFFGQLCYKKCGLLTGGKYTYRLSAFTCCIDKPPCKPHTQMNLCGGYSVSGDSMGKVCPHAQGGCLKNEELFDGMCYKRCDLLTFNLLPYRLGPATCCKVKSRMAFLQMNACDSHNVYAKGGGKKTSNDTLVQSLTDPHLPELALTEAQA